MLSCPKCHSHKNVLCLAGGIVLTQTQQLPLYCMSCKLNFIAKKKKEIRNEFEPLEFIVIDQSHWLHKTQQSDLMGQGGSGQSVIVLD